MALAFTRSSSGGGVVLLHQKKKVSTDNESTKITAETMPNISNGSTSGVRGIRNNNPFNMIKSKSAWQGKLKNSTDAVFEQFESMEMGIRAGLINLRNTYYKKGLTSAEQIINKYCPATAPGNSFENTSAYIQRVAKAVFGNNYSWKVSTVGNEITVAYEILRTENGGSPVTLSELESINKKYKVF